MINAILTGIFSLILGLVEVLLTPIDLIIKTALPDLASGISAIGNMFALITDVLGFVVSLTGLSGEAISLIIMYYTFKLTAPLLFSTIKQALSWYNTLKP